MNSKITHPLVLLALTLVPLSSFAQKEASIWLTNPDRSALFQLQSPPTPFTNSSPASPIIDVDDTKTFQTIDGFGFAVTGGSAQLLMRMDPASRAAILHELYADDGNNIGSSYIRVSVGASDMNDHVYSYDDMPEGQTDPAMAKFSLDPDHADVIPVLKEILGMPVLVGYPTGVKGIVQLVHGPQFATAVGLRNPISPMGNVPSESW